MGRSKQYSNALHKMPKIYLLPLQRKGMFCPVANFFSHIDCIQRPSFLETANPKRFNSSMWSFSQLSLLISNTLFRPSVVFVVETLTNFPFSAFRLASEIDFRILRRGYACESQRSFLLMEQYPSPSTRCNHTS